MGRKRTAGPSDAVQNAFHAAVRQAYFTEYGIRQDREIAELVGKGESALSQQFSGAAKLKTKSIGEILAPLRMPESRSDILAAWGSVAFEHPAAGYEGGSLLQVIHQTTIRNRPDIALRLALEGLPGLTEPKEIWGVSLQALQCAFRLDLPSEAFRVCKALAVWAKSSDSPGATAAAHAALARAMRRTMLFTASEIQDERAKARTVLGGDPGRDHVSRAAAVFAGELVLSEDIADEVRVHQVKGNREEVLRKNLAAIASRRAAGSPHANGLARAMQLEAVIHLGLSELEQAEAAIRGAMAAGKDIPSIRLDCEHLIGRYLAAGGFHAEARDRLNRAAQICEDDRFVYLHRLIQSELARMELAY
jgi:hypothetical protein